MATNAYDTLPQPSGKMNSGDMMEEAPAHESSESSDIESGEGGEENGVNAIHLSDHCFPNAKDGEDVKGQVEGTVVHEQGGRFLVAHKIDGYPVEDVNGAEGEAPAPEEPSDLGEATSDFLQESKRRTG